ncbi:MAG: hypothetical protein J6C96_04005 [Oscillospiraceae bacterium]|nr:hypothetical protein [Oscillospiraceae bacterium]
MSKTNRPHRPTRRQKEIIDALWLTTENYLVCSETESTITLYNKHTGKTIPRYKKGEQK